MGGLPKRVVLGNNFYPQHEPRCDPRMGYVHGITRETFPAVIKDLGTHAVICDASKTDLLTPVCELPRNKRVEGSDWGLINVEFVKHVTSAPRKERRERRGKEF